MTLKSKNKPGKNTAWQEFKKRHPKHPSIKSGLIHALPIGLIEALKKHLPDLWTKEDLQYEYDLNEIAGMGFFLQQPFWYPLLREYFPASSIAESQYQQKLSDIQQKLQAEIVENMKHYGCSDQTIDKHFKEQEKYKLQSEERQKGYAGWLVTSPAFQVLKAEFIEKWWNQIKKRGEFPNISKMLKDSPPSSQKQRLFYESYTRFYYDWGLETLTTPYLPLPMYSNPVGVSQYGEEVFATSGVALFIPWYLLADQDLNLHEIAKHHLSYGHKKHLQDWLGKGSQGGNKQGWGYNRFSIMLKMFIFQECGLYARYRERLNRQTKKIDEAFTDFLGGPELDDLVLDSKVQNTRKIRQELQRRLKKCQKAVETRSLHTES